MVTSPAPITFIQNNGSNFIPLVNFEKNVLKSLNQETIKNNRAKIAKSFPDLNIDSFYDNYLDMIEEASNFSDPADRATQEEEFTLELRARDRERKLVRKIDKTIARVDADDYGFCDACGIEIGLQRLEVRPTAEMCIDCKTTQEIKEKQMA